MTKDEAIKAMKDGKRVRHKFYVEGEYTTSNITGTVYTDENDTQGDAVTFWNFRTSKEWDTDWEIVPDNVVEEDMQKGLLYPGHEVYKYEDELDEAKHSYNATNEEADGNYYDSSEYDDTEDEDDRAYLQSEK